MDALQSADAQVKTAEEGLKLAQNEVAQAERRYEAGVTNSIEVTDAQTRLARARDNRSTHFTTTTLLASTSAPRWGRSKA